MKDKTIRDEDKCEIGYMMYKSGVTPPPGWAWVHQKSGEWQGMVMAQKVA